jgi:hypothetical protein
MNELLSILQGFSPIATIALSLFIILQLVTNKKNVISIKENHLHGLKELIDKHEEREFEQYQLLNNSLQRIEIVLTRLEAKLVNGKKKH